MNTKYRKTIIAGNWKMNMLSSDVKPFIEELKPLMPKIKSCETVLCVPAVNVAAMLKAGKEAKIMTGAQDVSKFEKGAYTGEVSASQLADIGVKYCIVGHSERRQYHGEERLLMNTKTRPCSPPASPLSSASARASSSARSSSPWIRRLPGPAALRGVDAAGQDVRHRL